MQFIPPDKRSSTSLRIFRTIFVFASLLFSCTLFSAEQPAEQAQQELQAVSDAIDEIQSWLEQASGLQSHEEQQLRQAEKEYSSITQSLRQTESDIADIEGEIESLTVRQTNLQFEKSQQQQELHDIIRSAYLSGEQGFLKLLLNQQDFSKSARMLHYYRIFSESQIQQIEIFETLIAELQRTNLELEQQAIELMDRKQQLDLQSAALAEANSQRELALTELQNSISSQQAELEQLEINQAGIARLIEEINRAVEQISAATAFNEQKGKLSPPIAGPVVERFGETVGSSDLRRQGIVIQAEQGTPVHAVHGGRVVFADWLRGSGLLVIVDHGEGFMSLYGANQALSRSAGDLVNSGDILATSGRTTSGSEGSREGIYFEIRSQGQAENPAEWIDGI
jgi:murein hydrolase activator